MTYCPFCQTEISKSEGYALWTLGNKAESICKEFHKGKKMDKLVQLEERVSLLEKILSYKPNMPVAAAAPPNPMFNKNGHILSCQCLDCKGYPT